MRPLTWKRVNWFIGGRILAYYCEETDQDLVIIAQKMFPEKLYAYFIFRDDEKTTACESNLTIDQLREKFPFIKLT